MPAGVPFAAWCFTMRLIQGIGSALEETAMYAIIADLDTEHVTLYLGICEISTGLGYMIGPPLGGFLFSAGGFAMPFIVLGFAVAPAAMLLYSYMPPDAYRNAKGEEKADVSMRTLLRNPQVMVIAAAAMLANSDYAFLEPTLGDHAARMGLASTPDAIGMLFSVAMTSYTLSCPVRRSLSIRRPLGCPLALCSLLSARCSLLRCEPRGRWIETRLRRSSGWSPSASASDRVRSSSRACCSSCSALCSLGRVRSSSSMGWAWARWSLRWSSLALVSPCR
jgi:MFS family permease